MASSTASGRRLALVGICVSASSKRLVSMFPLCTPRVTLGVRGVHVQLPRASRLVELVSHAQTIANRSIPSQLLMFLEKLLEASSDIFRKWLSASSVHIYVHQQRLVNARQGICICINNK